MHRPPFDDLHHRRRKPESPFSVDVIDRNLRRPARWQFRLQRRKRQMHDRRRRGHRQPRGELAKRHRAGHDQQTTISIELTDAVAAESRDRTLILHWTPPSPTRRREIDEWVKTFGCHWKTSDWTYKTTDNSNFFIGNKAAASSDLKTGETVRVTYHVVDKVWIADT
jgi:hypothetical protein